MKVSIITVCFNSESTIKETIESVLSQDYSNIEYIIVDGGSIDKTVDIIKSYGNKISKWVSEKDEGLYDAMNKGLKMAQGDVVGIINSDDVYIDNGVISTVLQLLKEKKSDCIYADLVYVDKKNKNKPIRYYDSSHFHINKFRYGWMPAHPTFFAKKHVYEEVGQFDTSYKIAADFEMLIRILHINKKSFTYFPSPIIKMRYGGASTSGLINNFKLNKEIIRACKQNGIYTNLLILLLKIPAKIMGKIKAINYKF